MLNFQNDKEKEILQRHAQAMAEELAAERAKSAEQREAEGLRAEVEAIAGQLQELYRDPATYAAQIEQLRPQLDAKQARLVQLGAAAQEKTSFATPRPGSRQLYMVNGEIFTDDTPLPQE